MFARCMSSLVSAKSRPFSLLDSCFSNLSAGVLQTLGARPSLVMAPSPLWLLSRSCCGVYSREELISTAVKSPICPSWSLPLQPCLGSPVRGAMRFLKLLSESLMAIPPSRPPCAVGLSVGDGREGLCRFLLSCVAPSSPATTAQPARLLLLSPEVPEAILGAAC